MAQIHTKPHCKNQQPAGFSVKVVTMMVSSLLLTSPWALAAESTDLTAGQEPSFVTRTTTQIKKTAERLIDQANKWQNPPVENSATNPKGAETTTRKVTKKGEMSEPKDMKQVREQNEKIRASAYGLGASEAEMPSVPSKYLRPNAGTAKERKEAVEQLKRNSQAKSAAEESVRQAGIHVGQIKINNSSEIRVKPGENVFIPLSREHPNRILTPFKNPQVISSTLTGGKKGECGELCVRDGIIYVTTDTSSAVTAFITEKGHEDIAFSVTMVPQPIAPREVRFTFSERVMNKLAEARGVMGDAERAQAWETSQPYVDTIREALRQVALGQIPSGYQMRKIRVTDALPTCKHPGIEFRWDEGQLLEGFNLNIYVGVVKNITDGAMEFHNQSCGGWKTAAVTTWPLAVLQPKQETEIYVVTKRTEDMPAEMVRKPLIKRAYY